MANITRNTGKQQSTSSRELFPLLPSTNGTRLDSTNQIGLREYQGLAIGLESNSERFQIGTGLDGPPNFGRFQNWNIGIQFGLRNPVESEFQSIELKIGLGILINKF